MSHNKQSNLTRSGSSNPKRPRSSYADQQTVIVMNSLPQETLYTSWGGGGVKESHNHILDLTAKTDNSNTSEIHVAVTKPSVVNEPSYSRFTNAAQEKKRLAYNELFLRLFHHHTKSKANQAYVTTAIGWLQKGASWPSY